MRLTRNLESELRDRNDKIENTILEAGRAHINKNLAEEELAKIKAQEERQRREFETAFVEVSKEMQNIRRFKEFLRQKQREKSRLEQVEREILQKRSLIVEKEKMNKKVLGELRVTEQRERKVREAFKVIQGETGVKDCGELLRLFKELEEKAETLQVFVDELEREISKLETDISDKQEKAKLYEWRSGFMCIECLGYFFTLGFLCL